MSLAPIEKRILRVTAGGGPLRTVSASSLYVLERGAPGRTIDPDDVEATETLVDVFDNPEGTGSPEAQPLSSDDVGGFAYWVAADELDLYSPDDDTDPIVPWNAVVPNDGGPPTGSAAGVLSGTYPSPAIRSVVAELEDDLLFVTPGYYAFMQGTFTPRTAEVLAETTVSAYLAGLAKVGLSLFVGPTALSYLTPRSQSESLQAGVTEYVLPNISPAARITPSSIDYGTGSQTVTSSDLVKLTGLTPGTELKWELAARVIGGLATPETGANPSAPAISVNGDQRGYLRAVVRNNGDNTATVYLIGDAAGLAHDSAFFTVAVETSATPGQAAVDRDGKWAIVTNPSDCSVSMIDLTTGTATRKAVPAGGNPIACATTQGSGQTEGYFWVMGVNGKLYLLVCPTATLTEWVTGLTTNLDNISIGGDLGGWMIATKAGSRVLTKIWLPDVVGVPPTTHTYSSHSGGFTGSSFLYETPPIAPTQNAVYLVGTNGSGDDYAVHFNLSTNVFSGAFDLDAEPAGHPSVMIDNLTLFIFSSDPDSDHAGLHFQVSGRNLPNGDLYQSWSTDPGSDPGPSGGVCGYGGQILVSSPTQELLGDWMGCRMVIRPSINFGEMAKVSFVGAD